jgi:hypothetical protein
MTTLATIIESLSLGISRKVQATRSAHKYVAALGAAAVLAQPIAMASDHWLWREHIATPSTPAAVLSPAARPAVPGYDWLWHEQVPAALPRPLYVARTTDRDGAPGHVLWREQIKHDAGPVMQATGTVDIPASYKVTSAPNLSKYDLKVPVGSPSPSSGDTKTGRLSPSSILRSCSRWFSPIPWR